MAESWEQFELLDNPALLKLIFYPRREMFSVADSSRVMSFSLPVETDISLSCKFFVGDKSAANVLFFHGNGEVAADYADIGEAFNGIGINLFVADYRGYGSSGGKPSISRMIKDAHAILQGFTGRLNELGYSGSRFIMGRSLGSASAIELATSYPDDFRGIILESGFCDVSDLLDRFGISLKLAGGAPYVSAGFERVARIKMPALIIHGEWDSIVPVNEGKKIYDHIGSADKKMLVIEGADHNTIFMVGMEQYLQELSAFVKLYK